MHTAVVYHSLFYHYRVLQNQFGKTKQYPAGMVDQALCFGWIDGVRKSLDDISYAIRFTPRRPQSTWSSVNLKRMSKLIKQRLAHSSGLKAFNERDLKKSGRYSYEQRKTLQLDPTYEAQLKVHPKAWEDFQSQPPSRPPDSHLLDYERRTRNDQVKTADSSHRRLGAGTDNPSAYSPTQAKAMILHPGVRVSQKVFSIPASPVAVTTDPTNG